MTTGLQQIENYPGGGVRSKQIGLRVYLAALDSGPLSLPGGIRGQRFPPASIRAAAIWCTSLTNSRRRGRGIPSGLGRVPGHGDPVAMR
jgi:hypothetical protein